jgi:hypothetical protein
MFPFGNHAPEALWIVISGAVMGAVLVIAPVGEMLNNRNFL